MQKEAEQQVDEGRREAQRHARKPPVVVAFVGTYILLAAYRFGVHIDREWYDTLRKPPWMLPLWLQEAGWVVAFGLLAYSTVVIFRKASGTETGHTVFALRILHYVLLQAVVFLLFASHLLLPAAIAATLLIATAAVIAAVAHRRSQRVAAAIGVYTVWLLYDASALWGLWWLNR